MRRADTSAEAHAVQAAIQREMSPHRRVSLAVEMAEDLNAIAAEGVRARQPDYDDERVRWAGVQAPSG